MLDFGVLPPEINSARMYSGPGSGPMLAAAAAWDVLAEQLWSTAVGCGSVIAELTSGQWLGPSSAAMADAAAPYVAWLHNAAAQAEQSAAQAKEAAAAYELAFAATVPPPVIAANRSLLMTLIATNFFGQNTPAIAATETYYAEMWAQDAVAMYSYAGSSSTATTLTPFNPPPSTTKLGGAGGPVRRGRPCCQQLRWNSSTTLSQLISEMPTALAQLAAPAAPSDPLLTPQALVTIALTPTRFVNMALGPSSATTSGRGITIANERLAFQVDSGWGRRRRRWPMRRRHTWRGCTMPRREPSKAPCRPKKPPRRLSWPSRRRCRRQ